MSSIIHINKEYLGYFVKLKLKKKCPYKLNTTAKWNSVQNAITCITSDSMQMTIRNSLTTAETADTSTKLWRTKVFVFWTHNSRRVSSSRHIWLTNIRSWTLRFLESVMWNAQMPSVRRTSLGTRSPPKWFTCVMIMPTWNTSIFAPHATLPGNLLDKIEIEITNNQFRNITI
jgi:hypothetical protein